MGYTVYFLLLDEDGKEVYYEQSHGSYHSIDYHWFASRYENEYEYEGTREMGEVQYLFEIDDMKRDYAKYAFPISFEALKHSTVPKLATFAEVLKIKTKLEQVVGGPMYDLTKFHEMLTNLPSSGTKKQLHELQSEIEAVFKTRDSFDEVSIDAVEELKEWIDRCEEHNATSLILGFLP